MSKHWILVAEDDRIIRSLILTLLEPEGHHLLAARDGLHALNLSRGHAGTIVLLITNVNRPEITGHELARQIKLTRPDIRIIIVSGDKEEDFPPDAKDHNVAILKPIDPKRLIRKVRESLPAYAA
jgi:CheY-like chemotaxis protein